eukprot:1069-Heterococcus_DN1.PRE.2
MPLKKDVSPPSNTKFLPFRPKRVFRSQTTRSSSKHTAITNGIYSLQGNMLQEARNLNRGPSTGSQGTNLHTVQQHHTAVVGTRNTDATGYSTVATNA